MDIGLAMAAAGAAGICVLAVLLLLAFLKIGELAERLCECQDAIAFARLQVFVGRRFLDQWQDGTLHQVNPALHQEWIAFRSERRRA